MNQSYPITHNFFISREEIEQKINNLVHKNITTKEDCKSYLKEFSDITSLISQEGAHRYICNSCYSNNETYKNLYISFVSEISPKREVQQNSIIKNILKHKEILKEFSEEEYQIFFKSLIVSEELYRDENVKLQSEIDIESEKFSQLVGKMSIDNNGQELTLQQAKPFLESQNREVRKDMYQKISKRRFDDNEEFDQILTNLISLRTQVAKNAGFTSYTDYKFKELCRFDYTKQDVEQFRTSIIEFFVPLRQQLLEFRKVKLGVSTVKPFDTEVDIFSIVLQKPFETIPELKDKVTSILSNVSSQFGQILTQLDNKQLLDLETRKFKASNGYNYPLSLSGDSFVFMNSSQTRDSVITLLHEAGHAIHNNFSKNLGLVFFKDTPSEVAELASMSMELISIPYRNTFYPQQTEQNQLLFKKYEDIVDTFCRVGLVDHFQTRIYDNPDHTVAQRHQKRSELYEIYNPGLDRSTFDNYKDTLRQKQMHIFDMPFYYIEYAIAQLGAVSIRKNSEQDYSQAIGDYSTFLKLGNTLSIPKLYQSAGISFGFSSGYIKEIASFLSTKIHNTTSLLN